MKFYACHCSTISLFHAIPSFVHYLIFFPFRRTWGVGQDLQILVEHLKCRFWQSLDSLIQEGRESKTVLERQNYIRLTLSQCSLGSIWNWNDCFSSKWKIHLEFRNKMSLLQNHFKDPIYHCRKPPSTSGR